MKLTGFSCGKSTFPLSFGGNRCFGGNWCFSPSCYRLDWPVRTLSFSHDGKMLASASEDHFIDIAEVETGTLIWILCEWHLASGLWSCFSSAPSPLVWDGFVLLRHSVQRNGLTEGQEQVGREVAAGKHFVLFLPLSKNTFLKRWGFCFVFSIRSHCVALTDLKPLI